MNKIIFMKMRNIYALFLLISLCCLVLPAVAQAIDVTDGTSLRNALISGASGREIRLMNDINISNNWEPVNVTNASIGTFTLNGNGFVISLNIKTNTTTGSNTGLFGQISTGNVIIRNIGIINRGIIASKTGSNGGPYYLHVGGYIGHITAGTVTIENSFLSGNSIITERPSGDSSLRAFVGGFIGHIAGGNVTIRNSYVNSIITAESAGNMLGAPFNANHSNAGGLVGRLTAGTLTISNNYASGSVWAASNKGVLASPNTAYCGGLIGRADINPTISYCYWANKLWIQDYGGTGVFNSLGTQIEPATLQSTPPTALSNTAGMSIYNNTTINSGFPTMPMFHRARGITLSTASYTFTGPNFGSQTVSGTLKESLAGTWDDITFSGNNFTFTTNPIRIISTSNSPNFSTSFSPLSSTSFGNYSFSARTNGGFTSNANVTIQTRPEIITHPQNQTVTVGGTAAFNVTETGSTPLSYQWQRSNNGSTWSNVGTNSSYYSFIVQSTDNNYQFRVIVSNTHGNATSNAARLTVVSRPTITNHPQNRTVTVGVTATFSATANGTIPLNYQWQRSNNGSSWSNVGTNSATYSLVTNSTDDGAQFRVMVSNSHDSQSDSSVSTTSNSAKLTVFSRPTIINHPQSQTAPTGVTVTFNVTATGTTQLNYQWQRSNDGSSWSNVGTNSSVYSLIAYSTDDGAQFKVLVSNSHDSPTDSSVYTVSTTAILTVAHNTANSKLYFSPQNIKSGKNRTFAVTFGVDSSQEYDVMECILAYDPAFIEFQNVTQLLPSPHILMQYAGELGKVSFGIGNLVGATLSGDRAIATLTFKALKETSGTDISIIQLLGYGAGSSKLQYLGNPIEFTTSGSTVTVSDNEATLKVSFQGRVVGTNANIEELTVILANNVTMVTEEIVTTDHNGEAQITIPTQNTELTMWVKGERTLAVSRYVNKIDNGSIVNISLIGGDANNDNKVDMNDFYLLASNYGRNSLTVGFNRLADFNNDGAVDMDDVYIFASNYGKSGVQRPEGASMMSLGNIIPDMSANDENIEYVRDSEGGCNAGIAGFAVIALLILPIFFKGAFNVKKVLYILLVLFVICFASVTAYAAGHTMMISTDKDIFEVGEKFNVSVVVTLETSEVLSGISSVISFDSMALSVDNNPNAVSASLRTVGGFTVPIPDQAPAPYLVGGSITTLFPPTITVQQGVYVPLENVQFEALNPGVYELTLPEDSANPGSAKASALTRNEGSGAVLVPSTKISKMITIENPVETTYIISASPDLSFGSLQTQYLQPAAQIVTITNEGSGSVMLTQPRSDIYEIGNLSATILAVNGATATFTVRPKAGLVTGNYNETISISGSDGASTSVNVSFAVTTTPIAPTITSANNTSVTFGAGGTFQVTASGDAPITFSLTGAPTGVTINSASGLITIATTTAEGIHLFTVTATNGVLPNATQNFTLTVLPSTPVDPKFPSDKEDVSIKTGINSGDLEEKDGKVFLKKETVGKIAKVVLNADAVNTHVLPIFDGIVEIGGIAEITFAISGDKLLAEYANEIKLIGLLFGGGSGKLFIYTDDPAGYGDGKFTLLSGGVVYDGKIDPKATYTLVVYIKDSGILDLDGLLDGKITSSVFVASVKKNEEGDSGGCNAGYGYLALAILPFVFRRKGK